ncbi:prolyl oligopeptidase family serine peptidase [Nocardioides sp. HDW12B]|uniref:prolyl oligopeptidase family serine peptidase n=1 Tax=Nocardioides sp. HDW12B TaxID=2714939 RepID=UPI001409A511|nr:prolyl oligopeptidase family serine peptidase [Nocardioides sp. HDW12B]QIK65944.1 prolyl oligopeptidase family serine peptidase [Nocardioides sp. HDW12B]
MSRLLVSSLVALTTVLGTALPLAPASAADDVPVGAPAAAQRAEPKLGSPDGWPFTQQLSRTSGTGRLHDGASYWSDFVYDDHGAAVPSAFTVDNVAKLAPTQGVYEYPAGPAKGNGADVFVAAAGATDRATFWRVDWNTLAEPRVPIAVWTFDTDGDASTGGSDWPAGAGVRSDGIEKALVVSSRGAWLHDLQKGTSVDVTDRGGRLTVDRGTRSFVARVPRTLLPANGEWRVRLGAGLASPDGRTMATPSVAGGLPAVGLPRVYNLAFRTAQQEPPVHTDSMTAALQVAAQEALASTPPFDQLGADGLARYVTGNFWMEDNQADTLAGGDVSRFSQVVDWSRLARRVSTREPLVRGYSNRWYVSRLDLGAGVVANEGGATGDGRANYLSPVQPYGVYVPQGYEPGRGTPLTWILHSLDVNHNQYGAYDPLLMQQLCERRDSICATTLGRGPDGWYFDEAEEDFWAVWRSLGAAYSLSTRHTQLTGYSMGGYAAYKLGLAHPDLYAGAMSLAGPPKCGVSLDGDDLTTPAFGGRCTSDGGTVELVENARWTPYRVAQGFLDQLVPFTSVEAQVAAFDEAGLRHLFVRYPGEDHLVFATQDRFATVVEGLGRPAAERNPHVVDYTWRPHLTRRDLGIGATTAWWTSQLQARSDAPGSLARVQARTSGLRARAHDVVRSGPTPVTSPLPAIVTALEWVAGDLLDQRQRLEIELSNVRRVAVDMARAGLRCGIVDVTSDGTAKLVLTDLPGADRVLDVTAGERRYRLPC